VLIHEAIGDALACVFVDHGMLRQARPEEVVTLFRDHYNIPLHHVQAQDLFIGALEGVEDPEVKRKTIGRLFHSRPSTPAKKIAQDKRGAPKFLAQGTLYPGRHRERLLHRRPFGDDQVASHVGGLPERMNMALVDPCANCSRDEVRALGRGTRPAEAFVAAIPSGSGPSDPLPGKITREKLDILRKADAVYLDESARRASYDEIWQAFAALLRCAASRDGREPNLRLRPRLRAVTSSDGMTAISIFRHGFLGRAGDAHHQWR